MTRILLIRHGRTDFNDEGRFQGQLDPPLNAQGWEQARQTAAQLRHLGIQAIYSSDLQRARATAQALAEELGLPLNLDPRLREVHLGEWQGLLVEEVREREAHLFAQRRQNPASVAPPGGENAQQVQQRMLAALREIAARHPQGTVAVISHGFAIATVLAHVRQVPLGEVWSLVPQNGQVHTVEFEPE